jgi:hypothetical protein
MYSDSIQVLTRVLTRIPGRVQWGMAAAPTAEEVASTLDPARVSKEAMAKAQRMAAIQAKIAAQMQSLGAVPGVPGVPGMVAVPGAINAFGGAGISLQLTRFPAVPLRS